MKQKKSVLTCLLKKYILFFLIASLFTIQVSGCGTSAQPQNPSGSNQGGQTQQSEQPQSGKDENYIKAGMYKAGKDISAGQYLIYSDDTMGYYQVTKDSSGTVESIIANDNFLGTRYASVADNQYIQITSSTMLPVSKAPVQTPVNGIFKDGMYKVGRDIKAGEYQVISDEDTAYVEVRSDDGGSITGIVTNDNFTGKKYLTVKNGQYIKINGCHINVT